MATTTPNLGLSKPTKTTDTTWWSLINGDMDLLDALFVDTTRPSGNVVYYNSSNKFAHDASNFFWDETAKGLVIGGSSLTSPYKLDVRGNVLITSAAPQLVQKETGVTADNTTWVMYPDGEALNFTVSNDALTVAQAWLTVQRTGTTVDEVNFTFGGVTVGTPTGGSKGTGTINATAVYDDNVLLSDYIVDLYFDGKVREEDKEKYGNVHLLSIWETKSYMERYRHMPSLPGREEWKNSEKKSLGEMITYLWETIERQMLHIFELDEKLRILKTRL